MPLFERYRCRVCNIEANYLRDCYAGHGDQCGFRTGRWYAPDDPQGRMLEKRVQEREWIKNRGWEKKED